MRVCSFMEVISPGLGGDCFLGAVLGFCCARQPDMCQWTLETSQRGKKVDLASLGLLGRARI